MQHLISALATSCPSAHDDVWLVDSTPVECGRSRETAKRSDLAGWAGYGYCASHSRFFWGLRLHLIATPSGLPVAFALTNPKIDERDVAADMIAIDPRLHHPGPQTLIADKGYRRATFEHQLAHAGITLIRPALNGEQPRPLQRFLKPFRQIIESINQTLNPTRPRTPRRPYPQRRLGPNPPTTPRPHRHHLAQRDHPPTRTRPLPPRLRPLTPWNYPSSPRLVRRGRSATLASVARPFARVPGAPVFTPTGSGPGATAT